MTQIIFNSFEELMSMIASIRKPVTDTLYLTITSEWIKGDLKYVVLFNE